VATISILNFSELKLQKTCFVVGAIGDDDSADRIHADWLLEEIIEPVFKTDFSDFKVERADRISIPGRIDAQVIEALLDSDLVIADLTSLNPNAFYEIGIRHMTQKPVIHMHLEGQHIPFDIASFRSIKFALSRPADIRAAGGALTAAASIALGKDHQVDNPVTFARGKVDLDKSAIPADRVIAAEIAELRAKLGMLENKFDSSGINMFSNSSSPDFSGYIIIKLNDAPPPPKYKKFFDVIISKYRDIYGVSKAHDGTSLKIMTDTFTKNRIDGLIKAANDAGLEVVGVELSRH
jgi:hypothetical protein